MNALFFRHDFIETFYNCSSRTTEEWAALANPSPILGMLYFGLGLIYFITYAPFVIVIIKSDLTKYSCYKIMLFLGIVDIIAVIIGGFFCGYFAYNGMIYCMSPKLLYITGSIALGCWESGSLTVIILGFNRCIDFTYPELASKLFSGKKTFLWLCLPIFQFIYFSGFYTTVIFNANLFAFFFDPYVGIPERNGLIDNVNYPHNIHSTYNIGFVAVLLSIYLWLCLTLMLKTKEISTMSKIQRQTFIQSVVICSVSFFAGLAYVYMQFLPTPLFVIIAAEIAWLSSHGSVGIIYAIFNPTLRKKAFALFCSHPSVEMVHTPVECSKKGTFDDSLMIY